MRSAKWLDLVKQAKADRRKVNRRNYQMTPVIGPAPKYFCMCYNPNFQKANRYAHIACTGCSGAKRPKFYCECPPWNLGKFRAANNPAKPGRTCTNCNGAKKPKKANRRVKIQSRMQQQRQELESCAPCAAAGVATDGMGTVPANKTDQAIFLEPLPKLPPKPRVGKDIEKNARRMATWQRERGEVGLAREERKRVAANYKCMSKKQRFEFIAEPARLPKAAVIQGCGITWRSCVAATRRWCAGCGVVEEVVHL